MTFKYSNSDIPNRELAAYCKLAEQQCAVMWIDTLIITVVEYKGL